MTNPLPSRITPRQAEARRANGKLSQGPQTEEGKSISSMNALKFGFFARDPLLPGESAAEFAEFRGSLHESLRPVGGAEIMLVDRIAESGWRLGRFPAVEAAMYSAELLEEQAQLGRRQARALIHQPLPPHGSGTSDPPARRGLERQKYAICAE